MLTDPAIQVIGSCCTIIAILIGLMSMFFSRLDFMTKTLVDSIRRINIDINEINTTLTSHSEKIIVLEREISNE